MPRYYCDYCDTYLTHDSPSVRKQHNAGYKHKANVRTYYQKFEEQQTQILIDQKIKAHLGQATVFQQVGAAFNQHLASFPGNLPRPHLPVLLPPVLPTPGALPSPFVPGARPPVLPRPVPGAPGYGTTPMMMPMGGPAMGATSFPIQANGLRNPPQTAPGGEAAPGPNGAPPSDPQAFYQANPAGSSAPSVTVTSGSYAYGQSSEANH